ncbi:hypothetical protein [Mucilaginibacter dorajii]|uniref:hypothetical protein n=1 Tax=Mucilaginibacter dorajii TaxID=692994 RepID=UPI0021695E0D|nr:hypothetical protein [Mucilaginibacter dorajii]MCS3735676.1 hypothetical protein [Mucilaginibacter dorajii]
MAFIFIPCILCLLSFVNFSFPQNFAPSARYKLDFFTSENQFYLCDSAFAAETGDTSFWSYRAYNDRLAIADDIVGISTESFGHIKAELDVLDAPSREKDFKIYDHVVEGGLKLSSGIMMILNHPDFKIELKAIVTPGRYRIRIYSYDLKNINTQEDEGPDHYKIEIWTSTDMKRKVLKQFESE